MSITFNEVRNRDIIDLFYRQRSSDRCGRKSCQDQDDNDVNVSELTTSEPVAIIVSIL